MFRPYEGWEIFTEPVLEDKYTFLDIYNVGKETPLILAITSFS